MLIGLALRPLRRPLTPAEARVLVRIATGETYAAVAADLSIRPRTVKAHVDAIAAKLAESGAADAELPPLHRVKQWIREQREMSAAAR